MREREVAHDADRHVCVLELFFLCFFVLQLNPHERKKRVRDRKREERREIEIEIDFCVSLSYN
jgi:hypothetical protein